MKKFIVLLVLVVLISAMMLGCSNSVKEAQEEEKDVETNIKVGFLYLNDPSESGWTYAHNEARLYLEEKTGVETMYIDYVAEAPESEDRMRELIDQGCNVIVATSFGYMDYVEKIASEYPDVNFLHTGGYKTAENFSNYFGRMYNSRYATGVIAAMKSETNRIGYVAAFEYPELVRGINAFTLGAKSVKPDIEVEVIWTNSWFDPALEQQAAEALINKGADVLTQHLDSPSTQKAAQANGSFSVGYNSDMNEYAPDAHLISAVWNWGPYLVEQIEAMKAGTWVGSSYWGSEIVGVSELGKNAPEGAEEALEDTLKAIESGDIVVFSGPIKDSEGNVKVEEGETISDEDLLGMDWFVEGVIPNN